VLQQYWLPRSERCINPGFGFVRQYAARKASATSVFVMRLSIAQPTISRVCKSLTAASKSRRISDEFAAFMRGEIPKWTRVVKASNMRFD
jgi:hypothetical protein